jgi:ABC-type polysaccharide/polyol phosphate transport system ATPase subunit
VWLTRPWTAPTPELAPGFHHELSGRENVYLSGSILGLTKTEFDRKFDGIVEFAGLEKRHPGAGQGEVVG